MGYRREYIALYFRNQNDLFSVRRELLPIANKNREMLDAVDTYAEVIAGETNYASMDYDMEDGFGRSEGFVKGAGGGGPSGNPQDAILDIREYDVPYYLRVAIDKSAFPSFPSSLLSSLILLLRAEIRVGLWYEVSAIAGDISFRLLEERVARAEPVVLAFDIETTKAPLKFPDQQTDQVMMISYMIDGQGFLITNREIVGADIEDFEYTPKPDYEGPFVIFNEADEVRKALHSPSHPLIPSRSRSPPPSAASSSISVKPDQPSAPPTTETLSISRSSSHAPTSTALTCTRRSVSSSMRRRNSRAGVAFTWIASGSSPIPFPSSLLRTVLT